MAKRRKRNKKTEEENKDDLEKGGSLRMTRGTNAHLLPPPVGAGQTASHFGVVLQKTRVYRMMFKVFIGV